MKLTSEAYLIQFWVLLNINRITWLNEYDLWKCDATCFAHVHGGCACSRWTDEVLSPFYITGVSGVFPSLFRFAALYGLCHYPSLRRWTTARNNFGPRGNLPCKILADRAADSRDGTRNAVGLGFVGLVTCYFACDYLGCIDLPLVRVLRTELKYFLNKIKTRYE